MKLEAYKITRTWDSGETTEHTFWGDAEADLYFELKNVTPVLAAEWLQIELKARDISNKEATHFHIGATKRYLEMFAHKFEKIWPADGNNPKTENSLTYLTELKNESTHGYRSDAPKLDQNDLQRIDEVVGELHSLLKSLKFTKVIVPGNYNHIKPCQVAHWERANLNRLEIIDGTAKSGYYGRAPHWNAVAIDEAALDTLKARGWRVLSRRDLTVTK